MDQWTPKEVDAHIQYMRDFAARLEEALVRALETWPHDPPRDPKA